MPRELVEFEFPKGSLDDDDTAIEIELEPSSALEMGKEAPVEKETEYSEKDEGEIEIIDDTPTSDRNRVKSEPPDEVTDEELNQYSEKVAKRIKHFAKGYHDERREKEQAQREREELTSYARNLLNENNNLRENVGKSQATLYKQAQVAVANQLTEARREYKLAHEAGDSDGVVEAQEKLSQATLRADKLKQIKLPSLQEGQGAVQTTNRQETAPTPRVDQKAKVWADKNTWFGPDDEMTSFALGYHNKLVKQGVDPTSDKYYEQLNARMREVFPNQFEDTSTKDEERGQKRPSNVVAGATRSTAPRKIKLTRTQVAIAKKLGVPLPEYAKQVANEMER